MAIEKTITVKLYKFGELSDKAKDKARQTLIEHVTMFDWWDFVYQEWTEKLENLGFDNVDIRFSGFWSQGDGASFTADMDLEKYIKSCKLGNKYRKLLNEVKDGNCSMAIKFHWGNYCHSNTMMLDSDVNFDNPGVVDSYFYELGQLVLTDAKMWADNIYRDLEKEYWALTSDEALATESDEGEIYFTERGSTCIPTSEN